VGCAPGHPVGPRVRSFQGRDAAPGPRPACHRSRSLRGRRGTDRGVRGRVGCSRPAASCSCRARAPR